MLEVFLIFLRLGLTSFGGPVAHLSYFHHEFVTRRKWIDEHAYADLVALCQFLPGPASSQIGIALGLSKAGLPGAISAWLGFTLPSALFLTLFGMGLTHFDNQIHSPWLHGLKIVSVSIVAQAIWIMGKKQCPDRIRMTFAFLAAIMTIHFSSSSIQILIIFLSGILGWLFLRKSENLPHIPIKIRISHRQGLIFLLSFFLILFILPFWANISQQHAVKIFESFFRAGSLVFGGGHVVLPLLQAEVVSQGWVSSDLFMAGYGLAQAIPGPLFTFSAFLGSVLNGPLTGFWGALFCLFAIFLPSFLIILGALPYWENLRQFSNIRYAMRGVNAAVVGLLLAAFYQPVWTSAIHTPRDFSLALGGFLLLIFWNAPSWLVVLGISGINVLS